MKKLFLLLTISLLIFATAGAQTPQAPAAKQFLAGEVTAVDAAAHTVTVRADTGETATLSTTEQTTYTRLPPGVTDLKQGARVTFAEVRVGDRVVAPGVTAAGGSASRLILTAKAAGGPGGGGQNAGRRLNGRVVSVDASKKLIVVQTRGREGQESVTVDASSAARVLRYAPDSMRPADAVAGSLADVRAGENIRATGERSADGTTFKAEEVLTGSFARFVGTVAGLDAQRGELSVKTDDGKTVQLSFGARSSLRRLTPEFEQTLAKQRAEFEQRREQRRAERQQQQGGQAQGEAGGARREGEGGLGRQGGQRGDVQARGEGGGQRRGGPGGNNFQQMFESLPAVTLAELKKGDAVVVTVTPTADPARATVVSLMTGSAEVLRSMQQFQRGGDAPRGPNSPGLPGDVIGGGQGPTREPPK
jgi:Cu/Ag efflux protein CusF